MYRIYVHSFKDSNEDGIGDLEGIQSHIDHLMYMGVDAVIFSPFMESPMLDMGRDISDFKAVHKPYGDMHQVEKLFEELQERNIKIIIEIIPNHTSRHHKWFQESRKGGARNTFKGYYIWDDGRILKNGSRVPPSNWVSKYGGSAWSWDEQRQQYYYHHYHPSMPDLNHRDPYVREDFIDVFRFWLEKGADGILVSDMQVLFESEEVNVDEPLSELPGVPPGDYRYVDHIFTEDQPDIHEFIAAWREFFEGYSLRTNKKIAFLVDAGDDEVDDLMKYYITGADASISKSLTSIDGACGGLCVQEKVDTWLSHMPDERDALWMLGSPEKSRMSRTKGVMYQSALNLLMLLLPGAAITYYGEEIGLNETPVKYEDLRDPWAHRLGPDKYAAVCRDSARGPMPWMSGRYAAFTLGDKPWMPLNADYKTLNVEKQKHDPSGCSPLQLFHRLSRLRKEVSFQYGRLQYAIINANIFSFMRFAKDSAPYLVSMNFGSVESTDDYSVASGVAIGKVVAHARPNQSDKYNPKIREGMKVGLEKLTLQPGEGVVVVLLMEMQFEPM
ncbi:hypothetical protein CAPTEDRAFT_162322 [Capitella teleta]|uniref:Glycosyl hydrolase family 13 catalytic domain-containing protein n=1 Tax=Capitella teleta TaxID=283909 RepID=R7TPY6_CAPTE|nr:hypothetical protein CAPTEDRAFT_162322 [Capitella teleta]|eukprot:ELT95719.1 hypothetical protein CAPTEDRAFT_162322 [Capitella teleta]